MLPWWKTFVQKEITRGLIVLVQTMPIMKKLRLKLLVRWDVFLRASVRMEVKR